MPTPLTKQYCAAGQCDRAENAAKGLTHLPSWGRAVARIAGALVTSDRERSDRLIQEIEATAAAITGSDQVRAEMPAEAAGALLESLSGQAASQRGMLLDSARRLLALALVSEHWIIAIPALGKALPSAVTAIYEKLAGISDSDPNYSLLRQR